MSEINGIFSRQQINIAGKYLQTNARIGYVVLDVETDERLEMMSIKRMLDEVAGAIRTCVLY